MRRDGGDGSPSCREKAKLEQGSSAELDGPFSREMAGFRDSKVPLRRHSLKPVGVLALSGSSPEVVAKRVRKFAGVGGCDAAPASPMDQSTIDLTWRDSQEILRAFDCAEQVFRMLGEFSAALETFEVERVNPRDAFRKGLVDRVRLTKLTRSAWHLYSALSKSALDRRGFEKLFGVSFTHLGERIVIAIDALEWAETPHG